MTGLDIFLVVVLLGTSGALGLFVQRWQRERRQVAEHALLLAHYQPIVQAAPELEQRLRHYQTIAQLVPQKDIQLQQYAAAVQAKDAQLQHYQAIAESVPHKDAQLQRYAGIQSVEEHLARLHDQQHQWELHLHALQHQHREQLAAHVAHLQEQERRGELRRQELDQEHRARSQAHQVQLQEQERQAELRRQVLEQEHVARTQSHQATLQKQQLEIAQRRQALEHEHRTQENLHKVALQVQREQGEIQLQDLQRQQKEAAAVLALLEGKITTSDVGLDGPRYDFREAAEYKNKLDQLRDQQEAMVKLEKAAVCSSEWTINGDRKAGKKTTDAILKMMLRAFNGESDALVGRVRYDNLDSYQMKLFRSREAINKLGGGFNCKLAPDYVRLKVQELELVNSYQSKLTAEREEQRAIKEQMRDEQRAAQEIEKAEREAEQNAEKFQAALDKARREIVDAEGAKQQKLLGQVQELERKLKEAEEKRTRALSMAQQTRAGHVYVISNVGSFGEGVFKIGMTRRLDPQDRVDELGDASVPFRFDVHAMIYTTDAPRLEKALHDLFADRRVNKVNHRKEFFHVTLEEIETAVTNHHGEFKLTKLAEAEEFRRGLVQAEARPPVAA